MKGSGVKEWEQVTGEEGFSRVIRKGKKYSSRMSGKVIYNGKDIRKREDWKKGS